MPVHAHFKGRRSLGIASVLEIPPQRAHHLIRADRRFFYVKPPLPTGPLEMYTNRDRRRGDHGSEPKEKVDLDRVAPAVLRPSIPATLIACNAPQRHLVVVCGDAVDGGIQSRSSERRYPE